jgi:hypothetical protein
MSGREFHWVMTVTWPLPAGGQGIRSAEGTITAEPGESRRDLYNKVYAFMAADDTVLDPNPSVLFASLEPNDLGTNT